MQLVTVYDSQAIERHKREEKRTKRGESSIIWEIGDFLEL